MNADLADMLKISHGVGLDPRMVQGGGGNTSVKTDGGTKMYVKASGTALGDMREGLGYRLVDVAQCVGILEDEQIKALERTPREAAVLRRLVHACLDELPGRPSVETSLHAMLGRCVVHTHPSVINGLLCATQGTQTLERLFSEMDPPYLYIEFCGAGYSLGMRLYDELNAYRRKHGRLPEAIFLGNHGLFVTAQDADRALQVTRTIFGAVERHVEALVGDTTLRVLRALREPQRRQAVLDVAAAVRRFYTGVFGRRPVVQFSRDEIVDTFLKSPNVQALVEVPPMTPDQVVYCNNSPVWVDLPLDLNDLTQTAARALEAHREGDVTPVCVVVDGLGALLRRAHGQVGGGRLHDDEGGDGDTLGGVPPRRGARARPGMDPLDSRLGGRALPQQAGGRGCGQRRSGRQGGRRHRRRQRPGPRHIAVPGPQGLQHCAG